MALAGHLISSAAPRTQKRWCKPPQPRSRIMQPSVLRTRAFLTALVLAGAVVLLGPGTAFAAPALGADCGAGAGSMGPSLAGKVVVGRGVTTCPLTFTSPSPFVNAPACMAADETNGGGHPAPVG